MEPGQTESRNKRRHKAESHMQEDPSAPPTYAQLMELYKIAVDEYRFQVSLNAQRSRDYFVLNSAIIASGVALLGQKVNLLAGIVFMAGFLVALMTGFGFHTQHNYYRETMATKRQLEGRLGIRESVVKTTPSAGSRRWRLGSVTQLNYSIIGLLCVVNVLGALYGFSVLRLPIKKPRAANQSTAARSSPPRRPPVRPSTRVPPNPSRPVP